MSVVDEEIEVKLSNEFQIRTGAMLCGDDCLKMELLANLLYLYDDSWDLVVGEGGRVVVGNHQVGQVKGDAMKKPLVHKKLRKWLMLAELGHLVKGEGSLVEGKKFSRLVTGLMDRLEHKLGVDGVKGRVRVVASMQAKLAGKENFKSPAKVENKRLNMMQSPLILQNKQENGFNTTMDGENSPDKAWIPTGKHQLARTPPSRDTTVSSCLGDSLADSSCSPDSRRISSFYSPSVSKVVPRLGKIRRDKARPELQVSMSQFDISCVNVDRSEQVTKEPLPVLSPPPGRQLAHSPTLSSALSTSPCVGTTSNTSLPVHAVAQPASPPVPAVVAALSVQYSSKPTEPSPVSAFSPQGPPNVIPTGSNLPRTPHCPLLLPETPELPSPPSPQSLHRLNKPLPSPPNTPDLPLPPPPLTSDLFFPHPSTPVTSLISKPHCIPTGRHLPSTPQLATAKLAVPVEPSGRYELPAELVDVAIPSQEEMDTLERKRVEEEERKQEEMTKEVQKKMDKRRKLEDLGKQKLEQANIQKKKEDEQKRIELEERQQFEKEKKEIAEMKQQLLEKAKLLEEKEKRLKYEEMCRKDEEIKKKLCEEKNINEVAKSTNQEVNTSSEIRVRSMQDTEFNNEQVKLQEQESLKSVILEDDNMKMIVEQRKLDLLAKEKKLRVEAENSKKCELKKTELRKQALQERTAKDEAHTADVKVPQSNLPEISPMDVLAQPSKLKSPGRKPSKYLKHSEAEMRETQKREMMEAKIEKRKLMVEKTIQKTELIRKQARDNMEKFENDKMEKNLRKSIKSAEINLESLKSSKSDDLKEIREEPSLPRIELQKSDKKEVNKERIVQVSSKISHHEIQQEAICKDDKQEHKHKILENAKKSKEKVIRIGRRPLNKTGKKECEEIPSNRESNNEPVKKDCETTDTNPLNIETKEASKIVNSLHSDSLHTVIDEEKEVDERTDSVLFTAAPTRKSSRGVKSVPVVLAMTKDSRSSKRKSVALSLLKEESPPKKGKDVSTVEIDEKPKRGRNKNLTTEEISYKDIHNNTGNSTAAAEEANIVANHDVKLKKSLKPRSRAIINPPVVHDESSLLGKLETRRRRIEETILNPETVISASKLIKTAKVTVEQTSLEKKLSRQRQVVEEIQEETQNPSPVKNIGRNIVDENKVTKRKGKVGETSPGKKAKVAVSKSRGRNKIPPPEVEDESSLLVQLDKRRKYIEDHSAEELSFANKFSKKAPVSELTDSLDKKLSKQRNKIMGNCVEDVFNKEKDISTEATEDATKNKKATKSKPVTVMKSVAAKKHLKPSRIPSEDQEYFIAAEATLLLTRPRRNCRKRFDNLEGLASSSVSNTPTPGPVEASTSKFQFANAKDAPTEDTEHVKKVAGRKPKKAVRSKTASDENISTAATVEVVINSPIENQPDISTNITPKPIKKAKKTKLLKQTATNPSVEQSSAANIKPTRGRGRPRQAAGVLSSMSDCVYQTPNTRVEDEMYKTPQAMGSFSEVLDEEYCTPNETGSQQGARVVETVRKPSVRVVDEAYTTPTETARRRGGRQRRGK